MVNQLPQGWKEEELGKLADVIAGQSPEGVYYNTVGEGTPFYQGKSEFQEIYLGKPTKWTTKVTKLAKENDILMSVRAPVGPVNITQEDICIGRGLAAITAKSMLLQLYLFYHLRFLEDKISGTNGAVFASISKREIEQIKITYPTDKGEQDYIVKTLDAVAEMIKLRKETIQLTKDLIPAIFQEMFGDPITNPKGWEMKTFREVLTIKNGKSQKDVENANGIYPIYGSAGEIMGYANDFICNENSVIIGRKGNINSPKLIKTKFWNVDTAFGLEPNKGLNYNYLYVFCLLYDFEKHNRAVVIPSLVKSDLLEIKIPFPVLSMQEEFSDRIEQINQNLEVQQKDLDRLQELFDQLLQKAFTGELTRGEDYGKH